VSSVRAMLRRGKVISTTIRLKVTRRLMDFARRRD
jgi:hypothetical protein